MSEVEILSSPRQLKRRATHCQRLLAWPDGENPRKAGAERWFEFENMGTASFDLNELAHSMMIMRSHAGALCIESVEHDGHTAWFVGVPDSLVRARVFFSDQLVPYRHGGLRWYTSDSTRVAGAYGIGGMICPLAVDLVGWWMLHGHPTPWCLFTERDRAHRWLACVRGEG